LLNAVSVFPESKGISASALVTPVKGAAMDAPSEQARGWWSASSLEEGELENKGLPLLNKNSFGKPTESLTDRSAAISGEARKSSSFDQHFDRGERGDPERRVLNHHLHRLKAGQ